MYTFGGIILHSFGSDFMDLLESLGGPKEVVFALDREKRYENGDIARFSYSLSVRISGYRDDNEFSRDIASTHEQKHSKGFINGFDDNEGFRTLHIVSALFGLDDLLDRFTLNDSSDVESPMWRPTHQDTLYLISGIINPINDVISESAVRDFDIERVITSVGKCSYGQVRNGLRMASRSGLLPRFEGYRALTAKVHF